MDVLVTRGAAVRLIPSLLLLPLVAGADVLTAGTATVAEAAHGSAAVPMAPTAAAGTVHGTVRAASSGEPIAYGMVAIPGLERRVVANERGYFVLAGVPAGRWVVRARAIGYAPHEAEIELPEGGSVHLDFELSPQPVALAGVEAEAEPADVSATAAAGPPAVRVEGPSLALVPGLAEADIFRALQTLPAVAAASDFSSALYVRGGSADQNLVTLDGAPLFNPYHLGGLFAALDPAAVASVDVFPGALPARSGDRLSSAIRIRTRDGARDRMRGSGALGLISTRVGVDGPLPGGDGSYLLSVRRTYLDLITDAAFALDLLDVTIPYGFTDAHLKLTHDVGALGSVSASVYVDDEGIGLPEEMREDAGGDDIRFDWGSRAASLHYRQPLSATLLGSARLTWSEFYGSFEALDQPRECRAHADGRFECVPIGPPEAWLRARSGMRDLIAGADVTWYHRAHEVRAGAQLDAYRLLHAVPIAEDADGYVPEFRREDELVTAAGYVEDEWRPTDALHIRAGVRLLHAGDRGTAWLPRLGARVALSSRLAFSVGAGRYAQVLHSLRNPESLTASLVAYDLLAAVPPAAGLSTAEDVVVGVEWADAATSVRLDAYAKRLDGLLHPPLPDDILQAAPIAPDGHRSARGTAHGLELYARHVRGDAEFVLAYALTLADRRMDGERFPPRFHRRHSLNATAALPLGETGRFSARLQLASGQPYTAVGGIAQPLLHLPVAGAFNREIVPPRILVGEHNSARLPGYSRLDIAFRKDLRARWFGADVTLTPYLQILNVLNASNVLFAVPDAYGRLGRPELEFAPQLPVVPTFGVEWRF